MKKLSTFNKFILFANSISILGQILSYFAPIISPITFWPISFFGLLSPLFFVINFVFLLYWLLIRKFPFWINLVVLGAGLNAIQSIFSFHLSDSATSNDSTIRIISHNVRLFNAYDWIKQDNLKEDIFAFYNKIDADILCIQEFYAPDELPELNYKFQHIGLQNNKKQWHMAIYSKYDQIRKETVSINGERTNNTCIFSDMIIHKDTVRVYNIHLASNWFSKEDLDFLEFDKLNTKSAKRSILSIIRKLKHSFQSRTIQADVIQNHIKNSPYPVIVCGDFNDTPTSYAYQKLSDDLSDSFVQKGLGLGSTLIEKIPFLRIDYILHSPEFKTNRFIIHSNQLSDHKAIESHLQLESITTTP